MNKLLKGLAAVGATALLADAFLLERLFFKIQHYYIGKPLSERYIRFAHLSDIHLRQQVGMTYRKLLGKLKQLNPDIIFITGDAVDRSGSLIALEKFLRLLPANVPRVGILGNHEYENTNDLATIREIYHLTGTDLLINESKVYEINGAKLLVTGLDDINNGKSDLPAAIEGVAPHDHHFILAHSPGHYDDILSEVDRLNSDREDMLSPYLCLSGHNHGGQVRFGKFAPVLPANHGNYIDGWYGDRPPYLYVSRGFGNSSMQVRFWARSELALFDYFI